MSESARDLIAVYRRSHERLVALVDPLDMDGIGSPSYDSDWSIGQVLSHLGSQAEIFSLYLEATLAGAPVPGQEVLPPVWDSWNARDAAAWRIDCKAANEAQLGRLESLDDDTVESFAMSLSGTDLDLAGFTRMRISEHGLHTWDVAVALDPSATLSPDVVAAMVDSLDGMAGRSGKGSEGPYRVLVTTTDPDGTYLVSVGETVAIEPADPASAADGRLTLPAEAFVRLVSGRLDPAHTPQVSQSGDRGLDDLRAAFPGF